jgi:hypothetical protein
MAGLNHQVPGELAPSHRLHFPHSACSFQNIPTKMKKPISIRKVVDMMATVRNTRPSGPGS